MKLSNEDQDEQGKVLKLTINEKKYDWDHQYITGAEVRKLAQIPHEDEIFLAIKRPYEDEVITDETKVDLARPGIEHFFSERKDHSITIIVNTRPKLFKGKEISFQQVIELAFGNYVENDTITYSVSYSKGVHGQKGTMVKGDIIKVKEGEIFNATATDKS